MGKAVHASKVCTPHPKVSPLTSYVSYILWQRATSHTSVKPSKSMNCDSKKIISSTISRARRGLLGKACQLLASSGIAPNDEATWQLLQSKHSTRPTPTPPPVPDAPRADLLSGIFDILAILRSFSKDTACGPSVLRIRHLLDAAESPLPTPICSSLRDLFNLLLAGQAPSTVSRFLAGASLTALNKNKSDQPRDIRRIAVGETLRRLAGKCLCAVVKCKASDFFWHLQVGVACLMGAKKMIHGLHGCVEAHCNDEDFVVLKIDLRNAFNLVSRQAFLDECAAHFP